MKRILLTSGMLLLCSTGAALAQDVPAAPPATEAPMDTAPATEPGAMPPESAAPAPAPAGSTAPPSTTAQPGAGPNMPPAAAAAPADWAKFDGGSKGYLTALEFGNWLLAKQGNDMSAEVAKTKTSKKAGIPAVKVLNATGSEFLKADKNGDRRITPDELAGYVAG